MNAYESNINERIANAKAMIEEAESLKKQRYSIEYKDYSLNRELIWELMNKENQIMSNVKRSVRSLAKTLGFVIKEKEFMNWEGILGCIEHRWNVSQQFLHQSDDYTRMYFEH